MTVDVVEPSGVSRGGGANLATAPIQFGYIDFGPLQRKINVIFREQINRTN